MAGCADSSIELVVVRLEPGLLRCRPLGARALVTVRPRFGEGAADVVPGEVVTLSEVTTTVRGRSSLLVGTIADARLDAAALGLVPLERYAQGTWSPAEEDWGEPGDRVEACLLPILAAGPRPCFEMEQVLPGADLSVPDGADPILEAIGWAERGDRRRARATLMRCLAADLRCLDAHAHLGNFAFDRDPARALRHYRVGVAIGELTVPAESMAVLPWGMVDNRPFLRCLNGMASTLWRLGRHSEAAATMERLLWLCPSDELGVRFILEDVRRGAVWGEGG